MTNVFISYRKDDTGSDTQRIHQELAHRFGAQNVFVDTGGIPYGTDFATHILQTLEKCNVLVAVIGPNWLKPDANGLIRLHDSNDWVRREIIFALEKRMRIIPLLINRAEMPRLEQLPEELHQLCSRQALDLDTRGDFVFHIERLVLSIEYPDLSPEEINERIFSNRGRANEPELALRLAIPEGGSAHLPKPVYSDKQAFIRTEFIKRINIETERMGVPSLEWAKDAAKRYQCDSPNFERPSTPEAEYAKALHDWYIGLLKEAIGQHNKQLAAVRTVMLKLELENRGTAIASRVLVELKIQPRSKVTSFRPDFRYVYAATPAPRPPDNPNKELGRPEIDWYDKPKYFDEPYLTNRLSLSEDQDNKDFFQGSERELRQGKKVALSPLYVVFDELPPENIVIEYELSAANQPRVTKGRIEIEVFE